ncbi:RHS repeat-associated core domain-containing protein [Pseudomonas fluorescens]|uniref:RHS repeat-associated core domain-containing protein n=1 Tax=Pseudomonas fluorescens TaxID=294 RepID=A0A5E7UGU4_PSEFL|nr:RHS repeat-associated core domain-containing protein [Pseudomonas fluorescens]VVQ09286.1 hypothetical protein PS928_03473 [Pseudomonas fluorescens]
MPASTRETLLACYHYDSLDRLVNSTRYEQAFQRFYCKTRLATEIQGTEQRTIVQHEDQLLAERYHKNGNVVATLLATDLQRSVLSTLVEHQPNSFTYSPYGHRPKENGLLSLLGFNGERPDPVTGHYHLGNGYRQFNPVLMRFNSADSWSPFGKGGLNAYAYCAGDPINRKDPNGHAWGWLKSLLCGTNRATGTGVSGSISRSTSNVSRIAASAPTPTPGGSRIVTSTSTPTPSGPRIANSSPTPTPTTQERLPLSEIPDEAFVDMPSYMSRRDPYFRELYETFARDRMAGYARGPTITERTQMSAIDVPSAPSAPSAPPPYDSPLHNFSQRPDYRSNEFPPPYSSRVGNINAVVRGNK